MLRRVARALVTSVYCRQQQYITVKQIAGGSAASPVQDRVHCLIADTPPLLEAIAPELPKTFRDSPDDLRRRVAQGCTVCVARRRRDDGAGYDVVGYELAERGVFSAQGRRYVVGAHVVFSHWSEVLPAYRGRRIHGLMFRARDAYFQRRGGTIVVGVCATRNRASLHALARDGAAVVGTVSQVVLLGGLVTWNTPWERVELSLNGNVRYPVPRPSPAVARVMELLPKAGVTALLAELVTKLWFTDSL